MDYLTKYTLSSSNFYSVDLIFVAEVDPTIPTPVKCTRAPPCGDATITRDTAGDSYTVSLRQKLSLFNIRCVFKNE